tara:strand:+ start:1376 stop:2107 length:732 start_codon:yes stop_codon:yes gene_type:complete
LNSNQNFPLVVLAGGLGTRMNFLDENIPKILAPINDYKFIDLFFKNIKKLGFNDIHLLLQNQSEQVINYIQNNSFYREFNLRYSIDGEKALGTGGAIIKNLDSLPDVFWVMYGDTLLNWNVNKSEEEFLKSKKKSLMTIIHKDKVNETPNVLLKNNNLCSYSKKETTQNNFVDYGALLFKKNAFKSLQLKKIDISEIILSLIENNEIIPFEADHKFYEIGNKKSFKILLNKLQTIKLEQLWNE